jgi:hypothetical protein
MSRQTESMGAEVTAITHRANFSLFTHQITPGLFGVAPVR